MHVRDASTAAGGHGTMPYKRRRDDPAFAAAWKEAAVMGGELLEESPSQLFGDARASSRGPGDNGAGLGASHQTGWTGAVARLMHFFATVPAEQLLQGGKMAYFDTTMELAGGRGAAAPVPTRGK